MTKLLFVYPRFKYPSGQPPLGLASLIAVVKRDLPDVTVELYDATFKSNPAAEFEKLLSSGYDFIAFSVMTTMAKDAHALAALAKIRNPQAKVIFGGPHATVLPEDCLADTNVDSVVMGEGETTLVELLKRGGDPDGVEGTAFMAAGNIVFNKPRAPIENIDDLPEPERGLFDMAQYTEVWNSMDTVAPGLRGTSFIISRGCPYSCSFCQPTLQKLFGRKVRKRSPEKAVAEIANVCARYGISNFMFEDDTFLMDKRWAVQVCALLKERLPEAKWCCNMRVDLISDDLLRVMTESGLRKINIGIESRSQQLLDAVYQKGISIEQVNSAVKLMKKYGLKIQGYFMIGHRSESEAAIKETLRYASSLEIDDVSFSILTPFPGTALYEKEKDYLSRRADEFDYYSISAYNGDSMQVSPERIKKLKNIGYLKFYLKPKRLVSQLASSLTPAGFKKLIFKLKRGLA